MVTHKNSKQRGSIEIVILVLVFAAAIGLIVWRVAETQNAQTDAERSAAIANNAPEVMAKYVTVEELGFKFLSPRDAGEITYQLETVASDQRVRLISTTLKEAEYTCEGENSGEIGTLLVAEKGQSSVTTPVPEYTKTVDNKEYKFSTALQNKCYDEALQSKFMNAVPEAIVESIQPVKE